MRLERIATSAGELGSAVGGVLLRAEAYVNPATEATDSDAEDEHSWVGNNFGPVKIAVWQPSQSQFVGVWVGDPPTGGNVKAAPEHCLVQF